MGFVKGRRARGDLFQFTAKKFSIKKRLFGNSKVLYYCFPTGQQDVVAKTRLAAEELYKLTKAGQLSG